MRDVKSELFDKLAVPIETGAEALNMGVAGLRNAIRRGEVPTTGVGKRAIMIPTAFIRQRLGLEPGAAPQQAA